LIHRVYGQPFARMQLKAIITQHSSLENLSIGNITLQQTVNLQTFYYACILLTNTHPL
jgi:hypothetical protein